MSEPVDDATQRVRIRRAPRFGVFAALGGVIGLLATLILTSLFRADPAVGFAASFAYFCLFGVPAGILLGTLVFLVLDAVSRRRVREVTVESERVVLGDLEPEAESEPESEPDVAEEAPEDPSAAH